MEVDVLNMQGQKISTADLPDEIFNAPIHVELMHQAYVRQMANARLGTHNTKTRSDVAGGGKKPWKQKGTGRARQGSTNATQWVGGGRAHTPHARSYDKQMPRKMRRAALRSALSVKAGELNIVVVDDLFMETPKTKAMTEALNALVGKTSALVLIPEKNEQYEKVALSTANIENAKYLLANYLNIRDLMGYEKVVLPLNALDVIMRYLG